MLHVALYQPQIPPNVGNVARQCVGMLAHLHLIGRHTLDLGDRAVKRAGLDYWPHLTLTQHATPDAFITWLDDSAPRPPWLVTKHGAVRFDRVPYEDGDVIVFGRETTGLPREWHDRWPDRRVSIPQPGPVRSFNLANSVAVVLSTAFAAINPPP